MRIRTRKLIGTVALLVLVCVWGLVAMALAQSVLTEHQRLRRGALLRGGRARLGAAGDGGDLVDGQAGQDLTSAHDLIRKPVPIPIEVEDMLFGVVR